MAYIDYLPNQALIASPQIATYYLQIGDTTVKNSMYGMLCNYGDYPTKGKVDTSTTPWTITNEKVITDDAIEYTNGTINTGDLVKVSSLKLLYRYAGVDPLIINNSNFNDFHPSLSSNRTRSEFASKNFVQCGAIRDISIAQDGSFSSFYKFDNIGVSIGHYKFVKIIPKEFKLLLVYFEDIAEIQIENIISGTVDYVDTKFKNKLAIVNETRDRMRITFGANSLNAKIYEIVVAYDYTNLGSSLKGHTSQRVSEYKTVISNGVEKTMTTKSYDTFSGSVHLPKEKLQEVEYALAQATQGDYVFHIGVQDELYDQRVYLGRIEYSSPLEHPNSFEISISGQSLSYGVENPLIAPDSTDGYTQ